MPACRSRRMIVERNQTDETLVPFEIDVEIAEDGVLGFVDLAVPFEHAVHIRLTSQPSVEASEGRCSHVGALGCAGNLE